MVSLSSSRHVVAVFLACAGAALAGCSKSSGPITNPPPPTPKTPSLAFTGQPTAADSAQTITPAVQVAFKDTLGNTITSATGGITIALTNNTSGAVLSGTATQNAAAGVATFANLSVNKPAAGYTLTATASGYDNGTSATFTIRSLGAAPGFSMISAGGERDTSGHNCAIKSGAAWCWGQNNHGQLGDGSTTDRLTPVKVAGTQSYMAIAAGGYHTCAITTAGAAYCWGWAHEGQLGDSSRGADRLTPVAVKGGIAFSQIAAGIHFTCGLSTASKIYCWGFNADGEVGTGDTSHNVLVAAAITGSSWTKLAAGGPHSCAIDASGATYCWGFNGNGELGDGTQISSRTPVKANTTEMFTSISAGSYHTCALNGSGAAFCWGWNAEGEVGNGVLHYVTSPVAVNGGRVFAQIQAGGMHTCGVTADQRAWCWGWNAYGALGDGTQDDSRLPKLIAQPGWSIVVSGGSHTCGLDAGAHKAYCWGGNVNGEVGDGTTTFRTTPTLVVGQ